MYPTERKKAKLAEKEAKLAAKAAKVAAATPAGEKKVKERKERKKEEEEQTVPFVNTTPKGEKKGAPSLIRLVRDSE